MTDGVHVNFTKLRFVFWSLKKIFAARAAAMGGKATSKHFFLPFVTFVIRPQKTLNYAMSSLH